MLIFFFLPLCSLRAEIKDNYPKIAEIETVLFNKSFSDLKIIDRINQIEKNIFGKNYASDSLDGRTKRIQSFVLGSGDVEIPQSLNYEGYENVQTKEVNEAQFIELIIENINQKRSFKGLLPLKEDVIAMKVAREHAIDLISNNYISYFNLKQQSPDERYTLAGGSGATTEIIKGFYLEANGKDIKLTELLANQLIQAVAASQDDSQIMYNSYITNIGHGFALSSDKKRYVSVLEFVTKGGEFEPIKTTLNFGEKIFISGKVYSPYKFKAISIAYFDKFNSGEFDERLVPYFPSQDYIAYGDTGKSNFAKVLKGLGIIGAIGAAPFTGGATAVLAPALLSSLQGGQPREIPLKGGIQANSKGEFSGEVELNYQGKSGIYFISVLAELPGVGFPIVISRRVVRVSGPRVG